MQLRQQNELTGNDLSSNIIEFPNKTQSTSRTPSDLFNKIAAPADIRAFLEAEFARIVLGIDRQDFFKQSNSFDSVYISDLKPDSYSRLDHENIKKYSNIKDISWQIIFNDNLNN